MSATETAIAYMKSYDTYLRALWRTVTAKATGSTIYADQDLGWSAPAETLQAIPETSQYVSDAGQWIAHVNGLLNGLEGPLGTEWLAPLGGALDKLVARRNFLLDNGVSLSTPSEAFWNSLPREIVKSAETLPRRVLDAAGTVKKEALKDTPLGSDGKPSVNLIVIGVIMVAAVILVVVLK